MQKNKKSKQQRQAAQANRQRQQGARKVVAAARTQSASLRQEQAASQLLGLLADSRKYAVSLFEKYDGMAGLRNALRTIATDREEWAGLPMILDGHELTIEKTHPYAERLMQCGAKASAPRDEHITVWEDEMIALEDEMNGVLQVPKPDFKLRNIFWSWRWRCQVAVWEQNGKIQWAPYGRGNSLDMILQTLGASDAWGIEQESNAVKLLGTLVNHRKFKQYMLTGMFLERSLRSGVFYLFRRLRPTVAMTGKGEARMSGKGDGQMRILAALCMHPIGYYNNTWAGAMCPTDEVIAHLQMMRGDEHLYWRRANQHAAFEKEAGI